MAMTHIQKQEIEEVIKNSIRKKFDAYKPETKHMPFHYRLLGRDRMALYSFIQSLNTTFGTSIYEPVAITIAKNRFKSVALQQKPHNFISEQSHHTIQNIISTLETSNKTLSDKTTEIATLRGVSRSGNLHKVKLTKVDIWLEDYDGKTYLIDMKTVKPNKGDFQKFKRMLLEWVAAELAKNPEIDIQTLIAIPYNPYYPKPYNRWTMKTMLDLDQELLVGEELWDFLGGEGTYPDLLDCFERAGIELRPEIDTYFAKFK